MKNVALASILVGLFASVGCGSSMGSVETMPAGGGAATGGSAAFAITNESSDTICYVYISPSDQSSWGPDQLSENETIQPGTARTWQLGSGNYDLRLEDCGRGRLLERRSVAIAGSGIQLTYRVRE